MMKLSVMADTLEHEGLGKELYRLLENWGCDEGSLKLIRASSTFIFSFTRLGEKLILRLIPDGIVQDVKQELHFMNFLSEQHINCHSVVQTSSGQEYVMFLSNNQSYLATVFTFIEGDQFEYEEMGQEYLKEWGKALGKLHAASKKFTSIDIQHRKIDSNQLNLELPETEQEAWIEYRALAEEFSKLDGLPSGFIHFDFELDNLIWKGNQPVIIDLEGWKMGPYVADIAFALRDLFDVTPDLTAQSFQLFLEGYRSEAELTDEEVMTIPIFLRYHHLYTFTRLLKVLDVIDRNSWIMDLQEKIVGKVQQYRKSFMKE